MKPSFEELKNPPGVIVTWRDVTKDTKCDPVDAYGTQRSVHVFGEFNGGDLELELLNDVKGDAVQDGHPITQPDILSIDVPSRFVRPIVSGDAKLTISLLVIR